VTAAVARLATEVDHPLIDGYALYCHDLIDAGVMTDRARRDRLRLARAFLDRHPDLDLWMTLPLPSRLTDLDLLPHVNRSGKVKTLPHRERSG